MPSLRDLKTRIESVKNTRKITSAMKMVAAAKLRRAQEQAEAARPYAEAMQRLLSNLAAGAATSGETLPRLLRADITNKPVCVLAITADRGLCGMFNSSIIREARKQVRDLQAKGQDVRIFTVGRKAATAMKRDYANLMIGSLEDIGRKKLSMEDAVRVQDVLLPMFERGEFDRCIVVYNKFKSAMTQITTATQLLPVPMPETTQTKGEAQAIVEFEPDAATVLENLLPRATAMQMYGILLETMAGFYGSQMTAMDSATRNAGDMINRLTLVYNRTRQAYITKELIEIISGAEAV
ncbi:MAG: F0F1 ATP synthase subunit gamma [Bdellovibrionales bacterium]